MDTGTIIVFAIIVVASVGSVIFLVGFWRSEQRFGRFGTARDVTELRLDAAVPEQVAVAQVFVLAVIVSQEGSPILTENDLRQTKSSDVKVSWPKLKPSVRLRIQVKAPECEIQGVDIYSFRLYRGQDSPRFFFHLVPRKQGSISIIVVVYKKDDWLGSVRIHTRVREQVAGSVQIQVESHPLFVLDETVYLLLHDLLDSWGSSLNTEKNLQHLISTHNRRLQKLKERQAIEGITTDPKVLIEIEDIEAEIEILQEKLKDYDQQ